MREVFLCVTSIIYHLLLFTAISQPQNHKLWIAGKWLADNLFNYPNGDKYNNVYARIRNYTGLRWESTQATQKKTPELPCILKYTSERCQKYIFKMQILLYISRTCKICDQIAIEVQTSYLLGWLRCWRQQTVAGYGWGRKRHSRPQPQRCSSREPTGQWWWHRCQLIHSAVARSQRCSRKESTLLAPRCSGGI